MRYVDDFFSADVKGAEVHAMECFAKPVRVSLGPTAVKKEKLDAGTRLEVLGLDVSYDTEGVHVRVTDTKAETWSEKIQAALGTHTLHAGDAAKMAGRLSFAAQKTFRRAGRAALRPIFGQQYDPLRGGRTGP